MEEVKLAVIGLSGVGALHTEYLAKGRVKGARLSAVCDINREVADQIAEETEARAFYDHQQLIESGAVDAVLVSTPHPTHPALTIDALEGSLHVLCEKPLSVRPSDADAMVEAAEANGRCFAVMYQKRRDPAQAKMKQMVDDRETGELISIRMFMPWFRTQAYYDHGAWRGTWKGEGGGVLVNQAPHNLDELYGLGGLPERIFAVTATRGHDIEVEDDCMAFLEYKEGANGIFVTSTLDPFSSERVEALGKEAKLMREGNSLRVCRKITAEGEISGREEMFSTPEVEWQEVQLSGEPADHSVVTQNFVDVIRGESEELIAPGRDGVPEVELASAMILSGQTGQPVRLPVDREQYDEMLDELIRRHKNT